MTKDPFPKEIILGTQYWRHPSPEPHLWKGDMERLKETGLDVIQLRVQWNWHERVEGKLIWEDLDELFRLTQKAGIRVILKFMLETAPTWIFTKYQGGRVHPNGSEIRPFSLAAMPTGGWLPCFDNPKVRTAAKKYLTKVVKRYKKEKHLILWHAWNEVRSRPYGECACASSLKLFHTWIKNRYTSIEAFNRESGKAYAGFRDILPAPEAGRDYFDTWLFRKFRASAVSDNLSFVSETIKKNDKTRPVMAHVGISGPLQNILEDISDDRLNSEKVDFYGSSVVTWTGAMRSFFDCDGEALYGLKDSEKEIFVYSLINRRIKSLSPYFFNSEIYSNSWYYQKPDLSPKDLEFQCMTALAEGAKGLIFWQFHAERFSDESGNCGLVDLDAKATPRSLWLKNFSDFLRENSSLLREFKPSPASVAILYHQDSDIFSAAEDRNIHGIQDETYRYKESLKGFSSLCFQSGVTFDILDCESLPDLGQYKLVIAPALIAPSGEEAAWLQDYVCTGGELWAEVDFVLRKSNGFMEAKVPGCGLYETFGIKQEKTDNFKSEFALNGSFKDVKAVDYQCELDSEKKWFVSKQVKQGRLGYFRFMPGYSYRKSPQVPLLNSIRKLLKSRQLQADKWEEGLYLREGHRAAQKVLFVANFTHEIILFKTPKGFKRDLLGKDLSKPMSLKPWEWSVLLD